MTIFSTFANRIKLKQIFMAKPKILYVCEEIYPYIHKTHISEIGRNLPQYVQEHQKEIRVFLPRFGNINERRNQLHEVIRLSGMNLIINDIDHPLIIKVASIQLARMQVYFIDNEDYFQRKFEFRNKEDVFFDDNDERAIFYARGVIETVKKLRWAPDIVHVHGWFGSLVPMYIRKVFRDNPLLNDCKIVISLYNDEFTEKLSKKFLNNLVFEGLKKEDLGHYNTNNFVGMMKSAIDYSDAIIFGEDEINSEIKEYALSTKKPLLKYKNKEEYASAYNDFYDKLLKN